MLFLGYSLMLVPYAYLYHSTTLWQYDHVPEGGVIDLPESDAYEVTKTNKHFFFYFLDDQMKEQVIDTILQIEPLMSKQLNKHQVSYEVLPYIGSNLSLFSDQARLKGLSSKAFFSTLVHILNEIDPLDWRKDGLTPNYLGDLDAYGFLILGIQKKSQSVK